MFLLNYQGPGKMQRFTLPPGETVVGRDSTCEIVIGDSSVSRRHAQFSVTAEGCTVTDLSSRNGTYVNGTQAARVELADGDRVALGDARFTVESMSAELTLTDQHLIGGPRTVLRSVASVMAQVPGAEEGPHVRFLRRLSDVARTLLINKASNDVFDRIVQVAFDTFPAERAFLVSRDAATGTIVPRVARRRDGEDLRSVSLSRSIINRVMSERVSVLSTDAHMDGNPSESILGQSIRSFMCAPLWNEEDVIGVVYADAKQIDRFTSADLDLFTILANLAAVAIEQARLSARVNEEVRRRERLERYHSASVIRRIFEAGAEVDAPFFAQERDVSVLFADMVGFTTLSETLTSAQTAALLNGFFERMADCIFEHEGMLDKFIGDAVMAVFGAPFDQPDHAARAVRTAHSMQRALAVLNAGASESPIRIRIGIHSGLARAGDIGSIRRREYTVLGDVVNTASRLESSVAKPGQIIISGTTRDRLDGVFPVRFLGRQSLRGRQEPVDVYDASPDAFEPQPA